MTGTVWILLASLFWAGSATLAKWSFASATTPEVLGAMRAFVAGCVFVPWAMMQRTPTNKSNPLPSLSPRALRMLRWKLAATNLLMALTYYKAIRSTNVGVAIMLQYTAPLWITIAESFSQRTLPARARLCWICAALVGCFLLVKGYAFDRTQLNLPGLCFGIASAIFFGAYSHFGARARAAGFSSTSILAHTFVRVALLWSIILIIGYFFGWRPITLTTIPWRIGIFIGVAGTALPYWCQLQGLRTLSAFHATLIGNLEPLAATLFGWWWLHDTIALWQIVGMLCIASAIVGVQSRSTLEIQREIAYESANE